MKQYDKKYNLAPVRDNKGNLVQPKHKFGFEPVSDFKQGLQVLYYVGPNRGTNGKWRQTWTGPWRIHQKCGKYRVTIIDSRGKSKEVSIDRLKSFKASDEKDYYNYNEYLKLLKRLSKDKIFYISENEF